MNYATGHNVAGYLPESDVEIFEDFDSAKRYLISEMLYSAEYAETEAIAEALTAAAEEVNLWNAPGGLEYVEMIDSKWCLPTAWWICETSETTSEEF